MKCSRRSGGARRNRRVPTARPDICDASIQGETGDTSRNVHVVELASAVSPTSYFINAAVAVQMVQPGIGVGLQRSLIAVQVLPGMFPSAVFRICEPDGGTGSAADRSSRT
jgi:hypothetical protein